MEQISHCRGINPSAEMEALVIEIEYMEVPASDVPRALLLEADPSDQSIDAYLANSWCFIAREQDAILGACVAGRVDDDSAEVFNIAVHPQHQQRGIGAGLLRFTLAELAARDIRRVELGTGTFGHQLAFYQRLGFRVDTVWKNHFLNNYPEPIFESGIQHKDMLRLCLEF